MGNPTLSRGFKTVRKVVQQKQSNLKRIRSCSTCDCYFSDSRRDKSEICHNNSVTKFDITIEENGNTYCSFWRPIGIKTNT